MVITLPEELERRVRAAVNGGHFASTDEVMAKAAHLLLHELDRERFDQPSEATSDPNTDPVMGCMREDAGLMDEIVVDAYYQRSEDQ